MPPSTMSRALTMLPEDFLPNVTHVIIGRGKKHSKHSGNLRYSTLVHEEMHAYAAAENKAGKSEVISRLVARVRETGNFVREAGNGRWALVEEHAVRTTTAQHFRDALYSKYRSSKEMKKQKRKEERRESITKPEEGDLLQGEGEGEDCSSSLMYEPSKKRARCVSPEKSLNNSLSTAPGFFQKQFLQMPHMMMQQQQAATQAQADALSVFSSSMFMNKINFQDSNPFEPTPICSSSDAAPSGSLFGAFADTLNFAAPVVPSMSMSSNPFDALQEMPFFHEVDNSTVCASATPRFAL
ncbi:Nitrilase family, member 2 [Seminavis robusta]|uniref:Nitrilase family, member 2 n=1 Tax=Seminavis robusta TaxID=568900 RepID=A0A9N8DGJ4_9STRA|nr:Nitrilase family, member 2 [Seminavis robusta]|eukprot:Sro81_g043500.1 Nitrilase family, member 2 (297) ;mRNA; f:63070-63960